MATLIDFPTPTLAYDRRARHAVISEVSALDIANDVDAELQRAEDQHALGITYLEPGHLLALGYGDRELVRAFTVAHGAVVAAHEAVQRARERVHDGLDLLAESVAVDPYLATAHVYVGGDAA